MMKKRDLYISFILLSLVTYAACNRISEGSKRAAEKIKLTTTASLETQPMDQGVEEDAADDPAIWFNSKNPEQSRIIGTDKKGGLAVYNFQGKKLFYYADGNMNNVDIRYNFVLGKDTIDLVSASNRTNQSISIYKINNDGSLNDVSTRTIVSTMTDEVYGFCMYRSPVSGKFYAFVNSKSGEVEQWELLENNGLIDAKLVRQFQLNTQVEGMVADDENQHFFIGEEENGIWKINAEPNEETQIVQLAKSTETDNENISYDIEGLAIYYLPDGKGYLLASSQGNYSYAVYNRQAPHEYLGSFRITDGAVDGAEETDGIEIYSQPINDQFQHGLVVVQDGYNYDGETKKPQNFKLIRWENIAKLFSPALEIN
jgi:3-phytase